MSGEITHIIVVPSVGYFCTVLHQLAADIHCIGFLALLKINLDVF